MLLKVLLEIVIFASKFGGDFLATETVFVICIVLLVCTVAVVKVQIISASLKLYHHVLFTPMYQAVAFLLTGIFGIIYLDEFEVSRVREAEAQLYVYCLGLGLVFVGVFLPSFKYDPYLHVLEDSDLLDPLEKTSLMEEGGGQGVRTPDRSFIPIVAGAYSDVPRAPI